MKHKVRIKPDSRGYQPAHAKAFEGKVGEVTAKSENRLGEKEVLFRFDKSVRAMGVSYREFWFAAEDVMRVREEKEK